MSLDIECPQCGHIESVDEASLPKGQATLTCKQCRYKWPFHRLAGLPSPPPPTPEPAKRRPAAARARAKASSGEVTCPGCGLTFTVGGAEQQPEPSAVAHRAGLLDKVPAAGTVPEPAAKPAPEPAPAPRPAPPRKPKRRRSPDGKKTILVVEDVDYFIQLAQDALGAKYRAIVVKTVEEALGVIEREEIDLLVLDQTLGGGDGSALLDRLEGKEFPVLISTSRDETEMYGEAWDSLKRHGADDLVLKGMNMEESLLQKVADLLEAG